MNQQEKKIQPNRPARVAREARGKSLSGTQSLILNQHSVSATANSVLARLSNSYKDSHFPSCINFKVMAS